MDDNELLRFCGMLLAVSYDHLAVVKLFVGILGYVLLGVRIVNLRGERPSIFRMTFRFLLLILGPFHPVIDLLWLGEDERRQALRDKIAGTLVVRKKASPAGKGWIRLKRYHVLGFAFLFHEVERP